MIWPLIVRTLVPLILLAAGFAGIAIAALSPGCLVVSGFIGTILAQEFPGEPTSILRGLAVACGTIAIISAMTSDFLVAVLALLAAGVLIRLCADLPVAEGRRMAPAATGEA